MSKKNEKPINTRWELFCKEVIAENFNATQAAINAGFSKKTAHAKACSLMKDERIKNRISELINEKLGTSRDQLRYKVIRELSQLAFCDVTEDIQIVTKPTKIKTMNKKGEEIETEVNIQTVEIVDTAKMKHKAAIAGIKQTDKGIEIKYHSKDKSLELLGRYGALFTDKVEIESTGPEVHIYLPDNKRDPVDDN